MIYTACNGDEKMDNVLNLKLAHKPVVNAAKMVLNEITNRS